MEIDHEIISTVILLPSAESFKKGCCQYVHEVLVNCLFKLAQEKVWLGELTFPPKLLTWYVKQQKQTNKQTCIGSENNLTDGTTRHDIIGIMLLLQTKINVKMFSYK